MIFNFFTLSITIVYSVNGLAQFYYAINKIGNSDLFEMSKQYYFEPEKWFINVYVDGVNATREMWNNNDIPRHENSLLEEPCVVHKQQNTINKYTEKYGVK